MALQPVPSWTIPITTVVAFACLGVQLFIHNEVVVTVACFAFSIWIFSCFTSTIREADPREISWRWPFIRKIQKQSSPEVLSGSGDAPIARD